LSIRIALRPNVEHPDAPRSIRLLRPRREGPARCCTANNLHEITPSHYCPRWKTTLFGIQLPSLKQKIASSETELNAQCAPQKFRAAHVSDGSKAERLSRSNCLPVYPRTRTLAGAISTSEMCQLRL
jgi:hypothetical protein